MLCNRTIVFLSGFGDLSEWCVFFWDRPDHKICLLFMAVCWFFSSLLSGARRRSLTYLLCIERKLKVSVDQCLIYRVTTVNTTSKCPTLFNSPLTRLPFLRSVLYTSSNVNISLHVCVFLEIVIKLIIRKSSWPKVVL